MKVLWLLPYLEILSWRVSVSKSRSMTLFKTGSQDQVVKHKHFRNICIFLLLRLETFLNYYAYFRRNGDFCPFKSMLGLHIHVVFPKWSQTQAGAPELWGYSQCDSLCQLWQCHSPHWSPISVSDMPFVAQGSSPDYSKWICKGTSRFLPLWQGSPYVGLSGWLRERMREETESWVFITMPRSSSLCCC